MLFHGDAVDRAEAATRRPRLWTAIAATLALAAVANVTPILLSAYATVENALLHAALEGTGAAVAAITAVLLLQLEPKERLKAAPIAIGMIGMSVLDVLHSIAPPGHGFVLLRASAAVAGGAGFSLALLPERWRRSVTLWTRAAPIASAVLAGAFGVATMNLEGLPSMVRGSAFTRTAVLMNFASGVLFLAAGVRYLFDFRRWGRIEYLLFGCMATLFAISGIMFSRSRLWDIEWWSWHGVRLAAYGVVFVIIAYQHRSLVSNLRLSLDRQDMAEAELRREVRAREDLLATVSHDLKSPMMAISLNAEALRSLIPTGNVDEAIKATASIQKAVTRMTDLISDLLDAARIEAGQLPVELATTDPRSLLDEAADAIRPIAARRSVSIVLEAPADLPALSCDHRRVLQILSNLLGNAVRFSPEGMAVTVRARPEGQTIVFAVQDAGPGISAEMIPNLFSRYCQGRQTQRDGAGLGLFIAKGIVEAHGGRIWVESKIDAGSTFFFTLLAAKQAASEGLLQK